MFDGAGFGVREIDVVDLPDILAAGARGENMLAAQKVLAASMLSKARFEAEVAASGDCDKAWRIAATEVSVRLTCSTTIAERYIETGDMLDESLPELKTAFVAGEVDYPRVRAVVRALTGIAAGTIAAVEPGAVASARELPPGRLEREVERQVLEHDADAAAQQRERMLGERDACVKSDRYGLSSLRATLTAAEGREADALIREVAATVCRHDGRDARTRRADALMAIMHGESRLTCECEQPDCPMRSVVDLPARRKPLVQLVCDVATLLGLSSRPPVLAGHGPIDPDLARVLAEDATWQAILVEMGSAVDRLEGVGTGPAEPEAPEASTSEPNLATDVPVFGRCRRAGTVPARITDCGDRVPAARSAGETIDRLRARLGREPQLRAGRFPDGHGGHVTAPPGALIYSPSAALATRVRVRDGSCRFPGCSVPAARCELDHIVPFDHDRPDGGGWTIASNLQCLCKAHHQCKTMQIWHASMLDGGAMCWTDAHGLTALSLPTGYRTVHAHTTEPGPRPDPETNLGAAQAKPVNARRIAWGGSTPTPHEIDELIDSPTWWEAHMHPDDRPPSAAQIAGILDPELRRLTAELADHHGEHRAIATLRSRRGRSHVGRP
ncbi:HNH endonuclease [Rhodococcus sp. ABRD24]|uniref:HNH endonuclease signature motif containing protein n=1 Tax=Rhodococcus sp. ABRD24 TaxID=2507582 RepID=UPI00103D2FEF|nr:HNH endonuclease signature motif containing protein [Rhodococcus sp. ABRD24]QBJ95760.1 HNH endonuclease [Rhodococcus sp. ABRD24]